MPKTKKPLKSWLPAANALMVGKSNFSLKLAIFTAIAISAFGLAYVLKSSAAGTNLNSSNLGAAINLGATPWPVTSPSPTPWSGSGPAPVPCSVNTSTAGSGTCYFYTRAPLKDKNNRTIAYVGPGNAKVHCQDKGRKVSVNGYYNIWWGRVWVNGTPGWVNAVYAQGGDNNGKFANVKQCTISENPPQ